jgi:hypothetical protein
MKTTKKNAITIKEALNDGKKLLISWKWSISKASDTYGQNLCACYIDGLKVGACVGVGYDMKGVSLDEFINNAFTDELKQLDKNIYGGLNKHQVADGGAGLSCMIKILKGLGFTVNYYFNAKREEQYLIRS